MPEDHNREGLGRAGDPSPAGTAGPDAATVDFSDRLVDLLHEAALSTDRNAINSAIREAMLHGVPAEDLADHYIPAVARRMGDMWCADHMSFASVTIGVSRLQGMLRALGPAWRSDSEAPADAPTILLIVGLDTHHTLGAMVLAGQLRRLGVSVRLLLGAVPTEVMATVHQCRFDAVLISASCGDSLDSIRRIVESAKTGKGTPPVVIGGAILSEVEDVAALVGADMATSDPKEAIARCGLKEKLSSTPQTQRGH